MHDMRHTFASWLIQAGVSLAELKEVMRHADIKQTAQYAHLADNIAHKVVTVLDDRRFSGSDQPDLTHYMPQSQIEDQNGLSLVEISSEKSIS